MDHLATPLSRRIGMKLLPAFDAAARDRMPLALQLLRCARIAAARIREREIE